MYHFKMKAGEISLKFSNITHSRDASLNNCKKKLENSFAGRISHILSKDIDDAAIISRFPLLLVQTLSVSYSKRRLHGGYEFIFSLGNCAPTPPLA